MNDINDITDDDFIPFLLSLGVETYKKSFEWMLNDPDFSGVLRWIYQNLDHNNALSDREEYRYAELQKKGKLLSVEELESAISSIQNEYQGLCLPGDHEGLEDVKLDISMQKEKLAVLEKHETVLRELVEQNERTKEDLTLEITKLNCASQRCIEDEASTGKSCIELAEEVESLTNDVLQIIYDGLNVYKSCADDKEMAKRFFTFGPFESYRQSQSLFKSHFDLYTSKKFNKRLNEFSNEDDLRGALIEAKNLEGWLSDAICSYIESRTDLHGEQAKLHLILNYNDVHASQITVCSMEAQSAIDLLEQEESILEQQLQNAVKQFVERRTSLAVEMTARSALALREQVHTDLTQLHTWSQQALAVDRALYGALRGELRALLELLQFAARMRAHVLEDTAPVAERMKSMNDICLEQEAAERKLQTSDFLLNTLLSLLGSDTNDVILPVKLYNDLKSDIRQLKENIHDSYKVIQDGLLEYKSSTKPLRDYIWDGCTKQPNCCDRSVATMSHTLREEMEAVDAKVIKTSGMFNSVKIGDKHNMRKLWQWFLTDQARLLSAIKNMQRN